MTEPGFKRSSLVADWFDGNYRHLVKFLSRRLGAHAEVEDLAQEAFLRLLRVERTELIRNPQAYLNQVAANVLLEWRLRARQQRPHSSEPLETLMTDGESVEEEAGSHLTRRLMRSALQELSPLCQAVVLLRSQEDLSNDQIAERLGVSRRMVKRHIEIAYAQLRDRMVRARVRE